METLGTVGFVGLDELSLEMVSSLIRSGYRVQGFEMSDSTIDTFAKLGGVKCSSPVEAGKGAGVMIVLISRADQVDDIFFGRNSALQGLRKDALVILCSSILPVHIQKLEKRLQEEAGAFSLLDVHVSKIVTKALNQKIMVTASGRRESIAKVRPILAAMCEKLYVFDGEVGAGSKVRMVIQLLEGIHLVAAVEAMFLGVRSGIHPVILYDIISNAAGSSWVFANRVPFMLKGQVEHSSLKAFIQDVGSVLDMAKSLTFPLPLLSVAHQQLIHGSSLENGNANDATLIKVWETTLGLSIAAASAKEKYSPEDIACQIVAASSTVKRIGFIGLGAMGFGMATQLLKSDFCVFGYDVYAPSLARFADAGGLVRNSPAEVSQDAEVLLVMVTNEAQAENVLYGEGGAVSALPFGASIILSSTVTPAFLSRLERRLLGENKDFKLVDAPVSGGVKRAADGTLTIMASGTNEALKHAGSVLSALSEKLYIIKGGAGAGSCVKMVNQLLAGVHIAAAAEAMAFGARLGLNTRILFEIITNSEGTSWMFENRVPHMLDNDYTPYSALDIFVKDLGIVAHESTALNIPVHVSTIAHQQFLSGSAAGWGRYDDAAVVKEGGDVRLAAGHETIANLFTSPGFSAMSQVRLQ